MKIIVLLFTISFAVLTIISCTTTNDTVTPTEPGSIFVTSNPAGGNP